MTENRCRLVLIVPDVADPDERCEMLRNALRGGDVHRRACPTPHDACSQSRSTARAALGLLMAGALGLTIAWLLRGGPA